jgi:hypothetical protein
MRQRYSAISRASESSRRVSGRPQTLNRSRSGRYDGNADRVADQYRARDLYDITYVEFPDG